MMGKVQPPLSHIRVLELGGYVAAPYCGKLLADYGAEVVKVEPPEGDPGRKLPPFIDEFEKVSATFLHLNTSKRSVVVDLRTDEGRHAFLRLVRSADVIVAGCSPSFLPSLDLAYDRLAAENPRLVLTSISNFGQEGPLRDAPLCELVAQAVGGTLYQQGAADREPVRQWGYQACYRAGALAAVGTLIALRERRRSGLGQQVDVAIAEASIYMLEAATSTWQMTGKLRSRRLNRRPEFHPVTLLPCEDGYAAVVCMSDRDWELCCAMMERPDLLADPRYGCNESRVQYADAIDAELRSWLATKSREEAFKEAQEVRLPWSYVASFSDVLGCEQLAARRWFTLLRYPFGEVLHPGLPARLAGAEEPRSPAPALGADTDAVLRQWVPATAAQRTPPAPDADALPLAGLRVLDLTAYWAGPFTTFLLADFGAEVIKVERPGVRAPGELGRWNPRFIDRNRGKRSVAIDLAHPTGRELFLQLVAVSDVVVENFSARVMEQLDLTYDRLRAVNPRVIYLSMPGFGSEGPWRDYVSFGLTIEALAGLADASGYADGPPTTANMSYGDPVAGLHGAVALLTALEQRDEQGIGQRIDLSQLESLACFAGEGLIHAAATGRTPVRSGNKHPMYAPHDCYPCKEGDTWVALAVCKDEEWARLCRLLGRPDLATDPRYQDAASRKRHEAEVDAIVRQWTRERRRDEAVRLLRAAGVTAGPVQSPRDLLEDEHLSARGFFALVERPEFGQVRVPGVAIRMSRTPGRVGGPPPLAGEHTATILQSLLGLPIDEILEHAARGIAALAEQSTPCSSEP